MFLRLNVKRFVILLFSVILVAFMVYWSEKSSVKPTFTKYDKNLLVVVFDAKIQSADPRLIGGDANSQYMEQLRFLSLVGADEQGKVTLVLADKIELLSKTQWIIKLKKGIKFNNGKVITASDVVATYNSIMNPKEGFPQSPRKGAFVNVESLKIKNDYELEFKMKEPDASFLSNLVIGILPKEAIEHAEANDLIGKGYESGPYVLEQSGTIDWFLKRNDNFNLAEKPKIPRVNFKIISDSSTRYAALIRGDIDIIQNSIDSDKVSLIQKEMKDKFTVLTSPRLSTTYLAFNFRDPIFKNIKIRQAIAHAIDKKSILEYRLQGQGILATSMFPPNNYYFDGKIPAIPFNIAVAKEYYKEANILTMLKFSIKVSNSNRSLAEIAKMIALNLKSIGLYPSVEMLENSVFMDQVKMGNAKVWISSWVGFKDPDHLRFAFATNMKPPSGGNRGLYSNQNLDKLLIQGKEEFNSKKRLGIYNAAQEMIAEEVPYVFLWHSLNTAILARNIKGYRLYADGRYWSIIDVTKN